MVSLLPKKTWKNHGLRADLAESLDGLHPKFMRFPGGCWVEGDDFAHMNHWKNTIGDIDSRTPLWNIWGYNATHGLGFYEYLPARGRPRRGAAVLHQRRHVAQGNHPDGPHGPMGAGRAGRD